MAWRLPHTLTALIAAISLAACGGQSDSADARDSADAGSDLTGLVEGDRALGDADAPVIVVEYASLMCSHCEFFHENIFPEFRERYIEPGHVRFIFREFPTAPVNLAMAGFLLARCADADNYYDMIDMLFRQRMPLIEAAQSGEGAREAYLRIARSAGISDTQFDACLSDRDEQLRIANVVDRAVEELDVNATPTFVINGEVRDDVRTIEQFAELIDPLLTAAGRTPPSGDAAPEADDDATPAEDDAPASDEDGEVEPD